MRWFCGVDVVDAIRSMTASGGEVRVVRPPAGEERRCEKCWFTGLIYGVDPVTCPRCVEALKPRRAV